MNSTHHHIDRPAMKRFGRFALVGIVSLAVEYVLLIFFVERFGMNYLVATTISFLAGVCLNYVLSVRYVFAHRDGISRRREFTIFAVLSTVGLGLNGLYMFVGVQLLNMGYQLMKLISTFFVTWYNYFSRRRFLGDGA
ncbi:GtrA family protein [Collinsella vaginalis]|uniref:GtrA family protein n=1 Tax=Collinsella vaginalis TaxID=1870987 RepID=UPI001FE32B5F|nr:GtrA family protein [Collinsella vaginalis]